MTYSNPKILLRKPRHWWIVRLIWGIEFHRIHAFTFGSTIYAPRPMKPEVLAHEMVHVDQQKDHPIVCFILYSMSRRFRLRMELPAFRAFVKAGGSKTEAAKALSSEFYGSLLTYEQALCEL